MRQIKPNVVEEEMDGELLAIDDATGTYVAVRGTGVWLWHLFRLGTELDAIKSVLDTEAHADVDAFLISLENAGMLTDGAVGSTDAVPDPPSPWSSPALEKYDDLQDLLLLDPIHEVSEAGWPAVGTAD